MKKKIFISVLLCFLICASCFDVTYAYLVAKDTAKNIFTVGEIEIEITENYESPQELTAGTTFKKEPKITNTGNVPCYVRIRADFSSSEAEKLCSLDFDNTNWTEKQSDGYYYYKVLLQPGAETTTLFTSVTISNTATQIEDFDILIYGEAVQSTNTNDDYLTVWNNY